jgi:hypothetical protein
LGGEVEADVVEDGLGGGGGVVGQVAQIKHLCRGAVGALNNFRGAKFALKMNCRGARSAPNAGCTVAYPKSNSVDGG